MKKLLISCPPSEFNGNVEVPYELNQLQLSGRDYYDSIKVINPQEVTHIFRPESKQSELFYKNENITDALSLIVRSTHDCEEASRLLALNLYANNCELLDPIERFNGAPAGKAVMAIKGLKESTTPLTFISFTKTAAIGLLDRFTTENIYPLVAKPSTGKQGKDVAFIENEKQALDYIDNFYTEYSTRFTSLLFQKEIHIKFEYRVILLDGKSLGIVEKIPCQTKAARNAANGINFMVASDDLAEQFAIDHSNKTGLIGADVAIDLENRYYLIESNRAPQWKAFEKATGVNVALKIMQLLEHRLTPSSDMALQ